MQKKDKEITNEELKIEIVKRGKYTTIGMCHEGQPYVVTLSYGFDEQKHALYFHSAKKGLKLDFLKQNTKVCATIIEDKGYVHGQCNHLYSSIVLFGEMRVVNELDEKKHALNVLLNHLEEVTEQMKTRYLSRDDIYEKMVLLRLDIDHITGKSAL